MIWLLEALRAFVIHRLYLGNRFLNHCLKTVNFKAQRFPGHLCSRHSFLKLLCCEIKVSDWTYLTIPEFRQKHYRSCHTLVANSQMAWAVMPSGNVSSSKDMDSIQRDWKWDRATFWNIKWKKWPSGSPMLWHERILYMMLYEWDQFQWLKVWYAPDMVLFYLSRETMRF